jgi:phosphatidylglycerophosphate synthase
VIDRLPTDLEQVLGAPRIRPSVGVVLAADEGPHPPAITGRPSKMLLRVGGIPLVERATRMLLAEGMKHVVVVASRGAESVAASARRAAGDVPDAVQVIWADDCRAGNGVALAAAEPAVGGEALFAVVCADLVFTAGALTGLLRSDRPAVLAGSFPDRTTDGGAFVFGPDIFIHQRQAQAEDDPTLAGAVARLTEERPISTVPLSPGSSGLPVHDEQDVRPVDRMLRRSLGKPSDGPVSHYVNRPMSTRVTMALAPLRVPPVVITVVAGLMGLAGAWGLAWGHGLVSGLLIQATNVLDGADGETSRLQFRSSERGADMDAAVDRIVDGSLVAGVALWLWPFHPSFEFKVAILTTTAYGWGCIAYLFQSKLTGFEVSGQERTLVMLLGGRDSRLLILAIGTMLYQPGAAVAVGWIIYMSSVFLRVFLMRRRPRTPPGAPPAPDDVGDASDGDLEVER